jgi:hypothetical protein
MPFSYACSNLLEPDLASMLGKQSKRAVGVGGDRWGSVGCIPEGAMMCS